jgi:hypothetical protein
MTTEYELKRSVYHNPVPLMGSNFELFQHCFMGELYRWITPFSYGLRNILEVQQYFEYTRGISTRIVQAYD